MTEAMQSFALSDVEKACLAAADEILQFGGVPEPQLHMVIDGWEPSYLGYVRTRPYREGADAVAAISRLGDAPAAVMATRVMLMWEAADLRASLHGPGDYQNGMVVVEAELIDRHTLRWYPFSLQLGAPQPGVLPEVIRRWGSPATVPDATSPPVMAGVLERWRALQGDPRKAFGELEVEGFQVQLVDAKATTGRRAHRVFRRRPGR
jgi:hypothetical protein